MRFLLTILTLLTLFSCTPTPENVQKSDALPPLYPDYCDVTIPVNIAPLNFLLRSDCEAIQLVLIQRDGSSVTSAGVTEEPSLCINTN